MNTGLPSALLHRSNARSIALGGFRVSKNDKQWIDFLKEPVNISSEDIPEIELYMDQITTFMDTRLESTRRYPEDKVLTKTMINNYTKNRLLPPSVRKKYSREHLFMLIFIYHLKNMLSISDIQTLLEPISKRWFGEKDEYGLSLKEIYDRTISSCSLRQAELEEEIKRLSEITNDSFSDFQLAEEDRDYLNLFSFIYQLCYDIYVRKQLIESLIDHYRSEHPVEKDKSKKKKM